MTKYISIKNHNGRCSPTQTAIIAVFCDYIFSVTIFLKLIWITYYKNYCTHDKNNLTNKNLFKYKFYFHPKPYFPKINVINAVW